MPGNEVDETSRSYQQLMQMIVHLAYQYARTRQRLPKMTREQYRQFQHDLDERMRFEQHDRANAKAWYEARIADYHREASVLAHAVVAGDFSIDEESRRKAFLDGMRADIEHSVHTVGALSPEERGQIVRALDRIEADPRVRFEHGVFTPMTRKEQAVARQAAATSETAVLTHREELDARAAEHDPTTGTDRTVRRLRADNARLTNQVQQLTAENTALHAKVATLEAQAAATATAQTSTNGHSQHPAAEQQQTDQRSRTAQHTESAQQAAEADINPDHGQAQMEAEA
ncbi:hypothetical protein [Nocardia sp. CC201C]|uniref:hypothetical protein n=1 Tax=Nocardia sp. CC201C TaxID=3044575 RepID=UPI0024A8791B|nr:hypothetical protein [Nocardia sp. CC201C]